ncbi:MAG TPA: S-layer homology domain-containing protein [Candidatus Bathyarchaeia archaeon]|nr:S-layer homology domain-containing protein [Candidatus Bathyarchaeia archaeon]
MNTYANKAAALLVTTLLGTAVLSFPALHVQAAQAAAPATSVTVQEIQEAVGVLSRLGVLEGYKNQSMGIHNQINRAELAKMVAKTFHLDNQSPSNVSFTDVNPNAWYYKYASELVGLGIMQAENGQFNPRATVTNTELVQIVSKAMKRDVKSVNYWMERFTSKQTPTRGEVAYLLNTAQKAIPSEKANVIDIKPLNNITLIVTFDAPLTSANEAFAKAKEDFAFTEGLTLTNMPRLKTGSIATYIVPTSEQKAGTPYSLTYKGKRAGTFVGNATKLSMIQPSQVTNDTFEIASLKSEGVVDYGYIISAYSAGRGDNAFVLDNNNQADGKTYQVISSMQGRQVTITPEGGQPIVAKYVPFTQSTDGKQEPKFRLPDGQTLTPGVTYTVSSDWAKMANPTFVAKNIASLELTAADAISETSISVTLAADPGDELFSGRSVELNAENGEKLIATYKYSSRKGAVGIFDIQQNGTLTKGTTYAVTPVGDWAGDSEVQLTVK